METKELAKQSTGVHTKGTLSTLDPRQERFISSYFDVDSPTFGNCYQSAKKAGYSDQTARNLTHNKPSWLSEKIGQLRTLEPEHLVLKLGQIINDPSETTQNKLKAIEMLMRHYRMYADGFQNNIRLNIQNVLE